jgi:cytochrome P450
MAHTHEDALGSLYNPLQGEQLENPYPFYARARQEEPIFFSPEMNAWVVTKYDDAMTILSQPEIFSSKDTLRAAGPQWSPAVFAELAKGLPRAPGTIERDGKEHARLRSVVAKAFAPKRMKRLEPYIREVTNSLIDAFIDDSQAEMISQFTYPLPLTVVLSLIGIPKEDMTLAKKLADGANMLFGFLISEEQQVESARDFVRLQYYFMDLVNERKRDPKEDMISDLLETPPGEKPLSDAELARAPIGVLIAGHETTSHLISNGLAFLLDPLEKWQTLCAHPETIPQTVEELLRYEAPVPAFHRTTTREVTVGGITFPPETLLLVVFTSANRDEAQFPHADQFDIHRSPNRHLAFGYGAHFCLGAFLARMEAQIAFETLCQRLPNMRLVPEQTFSYYPVLRFRGRRRLEVVW